MAKVFIILLTLGVVIYYIFALLQFFGVIHWTKSEVTFWKTLIPFYYLFK